MNQHLQHFVRSLLHALIPTLAFVALVAFTTMPVSLGHHPGEASQRPSVELRHMT